MLEHGKQRLRHDIGFVPKLLVWECCDLLRKMCSAIKSLWNNFSELEYSTTKTCQKVGLIMPSNLKLFGLFFGSLSSPSNRIALWRLSSALAQYSWSWIYSTIICDSGSDASTRPPFLPPPFLPLLSWPYAICMGTVVGIFCWPATSFCAHCAHFTSWGHALVIALGHAL